MFCYTDSEIQLKFYSLDRCGVIQQCRLSNTSMCDSVSALAVGVVLSQFPEVRSGDRAVSQGKGVGR